MFWVCLEVEGPCLPLWKVKHPAFLSPLRATPTMSPALPSAPTGDIWPQAAMTRRRGCGTRPLASLQYSRSVQWKGRAYPAPLRPHI